jgi:hypothetical protein
MKGLDERQHESSLDRRLEDEEARFDKLIHGSLIPVRSCDQMRCVGGEYAPKLDSAVDPEIS